MGRVRRTDVRKYQIQGMSDKHHAIKRLVILGYGNKEIAKQVGCTPENICQITGSELFKQEIAIMKTAADCTTLEISQAIQEEGPKCLELLTAVRDNKLDGETCHAALRVKVAQDMLDRNEKTAKVRQIQGNINHRHLVAVTTIAGIKDRAKQARAEALNIMNNTEQEAEYELSESV